MVYTLVCHAEVKPGCEEKMVAKLQEASAIYKKDKETIDWLVHQDVKDPKKFVIVERFEQESSQKYRELRLK
jgi:quinol monooxygenase YgiN